jgi:hypothetical protein
VASSTTLTPRAQRAEIAYLLAHPEEITSARLVAAIPPKERLAAALMINRALFSAYAGIEPDPWQRKLLLSHRKRILLNCSRQSGKSTTLATIAAHQALYFPKSLILMLSPTQRQSGELFRKTTALYNGLGKPVPSEAESALTLQLENGSRIVSLPGSEGGIRGYSGVSLIIIDEASRVPDMLYYSVRPMLAVSGGRLIAASTPYGKRGWWYEAWTSPEPWERYEVPARECPRIPADFLAEEQRTHPSYWFNQEYCCKFEQTDNAVFRQEDIEWMFSDPIEVFSVASSGSLELEVPEPLPPLEPITLKSWESFPGGRLHD